MSTIIEHTTIGGNSDGRVVLSNSQIARLLANPDFIRIRIGFRLAFDDTGANLVGTPRFWFGLLASPQADANGFLSNGPANLETSHFVGVTPDSSSWSRASAGYSWGLVSPHFSAIKKIGSVTTIGPTVNPYQPYVSDTPATKRTPVLVEIKRGSPNFTIFLGFPGNDVTDQPYSLLEQAMGISDFTAANQAFGSTRVGSGSVAVDEAANGVLNAVCFYWDRVTPAAHLSEVLFSFFPS